jgi:hypothetical protein
MNIDTGPPNGLPGPDGDRAARGQFLANPTPVGLFRKYRAVAYLCWASCAWSDIGVNSECGGLKQRLPYPYNLDLSGVLRRLDRRTPGGRDRLANEPVTAAYLAAGMRLIEKNLGPGVARQPAGPEGENAAVPAALSFLSQRVVAAEVGNNPEPFHRLGSTGTLRTTWRSQSDYIADLIGFGLWSYQFPIAKHSDEVEAAKQRLIGGGDFVEEFHRLCYWVLVTLLATPSFRLGLLAAAVAATDEVVARAVADHYRDNRDRWNGLYTAVLAAHQVRPRPGVAPEDVGRMLTALADGFALRGLADPDTPLLDHERQRSLLGTAALAIIRSFGQPSSDTSPAASIDEVVRAMFTRT